MTHFRSVPVFSFCLCAQTPSWFFFFFRMPHGLAEAFGFLNVILSVPFFDAGPREEETNGEQKSLTVC